MWSILPSKPVHGLKGDAFAWCTFLTWHRHGKCSWMHLRAAGTAWQWRGCCSPALNMNMQEPAAASSVHHWSPGMALGTHHAMGHVTCHAGLWTITMQEKPKLDLLGSPQTLQIAFLSLSPRSHNKQPSQWVKSHEPKQPQRNSWWLERAGPCPHGCWQGPALELYRSRKTLKQSKCLTVQQENPFYYNLIKLIVKQRPCSTKTHSSHASCSVFSANGSQVHPKGIPPREVNPCKGHCVNHHALSLAAAVGNCLWRSRNETLVNPSPNITKIKHHHHPPHKWPWATSTSQLMDQLSPSQERCGTDRWKKQLHLANWRWVYWLAAVSAGALYFLPPVQSTIALIIPLKLPPDSEQPRSWNSGNLFNQ